MTGQAEISPFGQTATGQDIQRITLRKGDLTASILTYGAILQSVRLAGVAHDLTLGSDRLADYEGALCYHGALVAPVAAPVVAQVVVAQVQPDGGVGGQGEPAFGAARAVQVGVSP